MNLFSIAWWLVTTALTDNHRARSGKETEWSGENAVC